MSLATKIVVGTVGVSLIVGVLLLVAIAGA